MEGQIGRPGTKAIRRHHHAKGCNPGGCRRYHWQMEDTTRRPRRRFKKRYVALAIVLGFVGLIGVLVWQAVTAQPGPLVDYHQKMYDLSAQVQGDGADQWEVFEQAIAASEQAQAELRIADEAAGVEYAQEDPLTPVYAAGYGDRDEFAVLQERGRRWVESLGARGLFEHTANLPSAKVAIRPPSVGPMLDVLLPYLGTSRSLARLQAARMHLAAERGDWAEYTAAFEESLATARIVAGQTTIIDYLVGIAIESLALLELRRDLATGQIADPAALDRLLAAVERQRLPTMAHALEGERMVQLDIIQRVYTDDGNGDGRMILTEFDKVAAMGGGPLFPAGLSDQRIINVAGFIFPSRAETVADLNRLFDPVIADMELPAHERTSAFDQDQYLDSLPAQQLLLRLFTPSVLRAAATADQGRTIAAGTELLLRIERHRLRTGKPPATLSDLAAADPGANLIDPMSGEPFLYRLLTDDPAGRPYLLYAAGADRRDDGGVEPEDVAAEQAFFGRRGTDYVLNPPPPEPEWDEP